MNLQEMESSLKTLQKQATVLKKAIEEFKKIENIKQYII